TVPPGVALALRPRGSRRVGRRAVVGQPPVRRPGPGPLERGVALLPVRLLPRGLVLALAEDAAVDPAAAAGRAVGAQQLVAGEVLAGVVVAADLGDHGLGARLLDLPARRVVPREVEDRPVPLLLRGLQALADLAAEVVVEPEVGAAV